MKTNIAGFPEQLARDLSQITIGVTFQNGNALYNSVKLKPQKHPDSQKNIIYCPGCNQMQSQTNGIVQKAHKIKHQIA